MEKLKYLYELLLFYSILLSFQMNTSQKKFVLQYHIVLVQLRCESPFLMASHGLNRQKGLVCCYCPNLKNYKYHTSQDQELNLFSRHFFEARNYTYLKINLKIINFWRVNLIYTRSWILRIFNINCFSVFFCKCREMNWLYFFRIIWLGSRSKFALLWGLSSTLFKS